MLTPYFTLKMTVELPSDTVEPLKLQGTANNFHSHHDDNLKLHKENIIYKYGI
jgi:hypothetical protein